MIYLYVKTHNITGLKYFGKTQTKDPLKYLGSGKYWLRHLKIHGTDITTEIIAEFDDLEEASKYAIEFSKTHNIVDSKEWANLMIETVKDGVLGYSHTCETKSKISEKSKSTWSNEEFKLKMSQKRKESWADPNLNLKQKQSERLKNEFWTDEQRKKHSNKLKGRPGHKKCKGVAKPPGHGEKVSAALKGVPKSEQHKQALSGPKPRVCRLTDRKEMSVNHFTRWVKSLLAQEKNI